MLVQCRAKGNEDLICNLLLITPEGCCRSHQHSYLVFLLNSRNKCYKFDLDLTVFSIPFTIGWSWTEVYFARCYCRVLAHCKVKVAWNRKGSSLNYHKRITMGCFSMCSSRNYSEVISPTLVAGYVILLTGKEWLLIIYFHQMEKWRQLPKLCKIDYTKRLSQTSYENMNDCTWQLLVWCFTHCQ